MSERLSDHASNICATLAGFETVHFEVTPGQFKASPGQFPASTGHFQASPGQSQASRGGQNGSILEPHVTIIQQKTDESGKVYRIFISVRAMLFKTDDTPVQEYPRDVINSLLHTLHDRIGIVLGRIDITIVDRLRARQQEIARRTRDFLSDVPEAISVSLTSPLECYLKACELRFRDDPQAIHPSFTVPHLHTRIAAFIASPLRDGCCQQFGQHSLGESFYPSEDDPSIVRIGAAIDYNSDHLGRNCWWANHDAELARMSNVTYCKDRPFDLR